MSVCVSRYLYVLLIAPERFVADCAVVRHYAVVNLHVIFQGISAAEAAHVAERLANSTVNILHVHVQIVLHFETLVARVARNSVFAFSDCALAMFVCIYRRYRTRRKYHESLKTCTLFTCCGNSSFNL